jgi:hypothetical protein
VGEGQPDVEREGAGLDAEAGEHEADDEVAARGVGEAGGDGGEGGLIGGEGGGDEGGEN